MEEALPGPICCVMTGIQCTHACLTEVKNQGLRGTGNHSTHTML